MTPVWDTFIAWWNQTYGNYASLDPSHQGVAWEAWKAASNTPNALTPLEVEMGVTPDTNPEGPNETDAVPDAR